MNKSIKEVNYICASLLIASSLLISCATPQKKLSREEWLNLTTHKYDSVSKEDVFKAIEKIFVLADESDTTFTHSPDSIKAVRWTAPFPVHIWYHWDCFVNQSENGVVVRVSISTTAHGFGVPGGMTPYNSEDVYKLFFSRLNYLLGESSKWYSCDEYKRENPKHTTLEALCMLSEDKQPDEKN
jgi:hypothetical protein